MKVFSYDVWKKQEVREIMMKKCFIAIILLVLLFCAAAVGEERVDTLTYAVYPLLPDHEYYQELIEHRWAELEPNIRLVRAKWNSYTDDAPEGIDVIMYDAIDLNEIIENGWIQPISRSAVWEPEDIFPFALEGITVDDNLYGIPIFLCGNFLIYDRQYTALAKAEHLTDLADETEILVVNSDNPLDRPEYITETIADTRGEANPIVDEHEEDCMSLIERLAIDAHQHDNNVQVVMAYDSGVGQGYIGFSESMRFLKNRVDSTLIKSVSFSDG